MEIKFTAEEYRTLIDLLVIADWVLTAHRVDPDPELTRFQALEQKLLGLAPGTEIGDLVSWEDEIERFLPSPAYEEKSEAYTLIDQFEEDTFWEELVTRLARRDLIRKEGDAAVGAMPPEEILRLEAPIEQSYFEEFLHRGLSRLEVSESSEQAAEDDA